MVGSGWQCFFSGWQWLIFLILLISWYLDFLISRFSWFVDFLISCMRSAWTVRCPSVRPSVQSINNRDRRAGGLLLSAGADSYRRRGPRAALCCGLREEGRADGHCWLQVGRGPRCWWWITSRGSATAAHSVCDTVWLLLASSSWWAVHSLSILSTSIPSGSHLAVGIEASMAPSSIVGH